MPLVNTIEVVDRHNRPGVNSRVMLRTFFMNDGMRTDPYAVSSVQVFRRNQNLSPSTVLNDDSLVASSYVSAAKMIFGVTGTGEVGTDNSFLEENYTGTVVTTDVSQHITNCSGVSGIYRLGVGEFVSILDGQLGGTLSGIDDIGSSALKNTASGATDYIDIWTVKLTEGSAWKTFINSFQLFDDTFLAITEPLMLRAKNKLFNRNVYVGSKTDLKIGTEITVENRNLPEETKNIFRDSVVTSATVVIKKLNEDVNLPSRVTVVSSADVDITSDNTIIYSFDTAADLSSGNPDTLDVSELGSKSGNYMLQLTYHLLTEKIVSAPMYFVVK